MRIHPNVFPALAGGLGASPTGILKDSGTRVHACIPRFLRRALATSQFQSLHSSLRPVFNSVRKTLSRSRKQEREPLAMVLSIRAKPDTRLSINFEQIWSLQ